MLDLAYINTLDKYQLAVAEVERSPRSAVDSETYTLAKYNTQQYKAADLRTNVHTGRCSLLSLMTDPSVGGKLYVFDLVVLEYLGYDSTLLRNALAKNEYLVAQNAGFDAKMLSAQIGWLDNWRCTYALAQMYANATGSKLWQTRGMGLGSLCRDWLGVKLKGKGTTQVEEWYSDPASRTLHNPKWLTQVEYAAGDVRHLFALYDLLVKLTTLPFPETALIKEECTTQGPYGLGMSKAVTIELMLLPIVARMETSGLPFSPLVSNKFKAAIDDRVTASALYLCKQLQLPTVTQGLWGEEIPDPQSQKVLNNPVKLLAAITKATGINLTTTQTAIIRRCTDILTAMSKAESEGAELDLVAIESELDLFEEMDALSLNAKQYGLELLVAAMDYKKMVKQQSMLLTKYVNPESLRIHPRFSPLRAATSRFACSNPL